MKSKFCDWNKGPIMKDMLAIIGAFVLVLWTSSMMGVGDFQMIYGPKGKYKCEEVHRG